ncbi:MAG: DUF6527 family protein [Pseudomonadota bacterium]
MNMKISQFRHEFVEFVPERIEDGVVYVSIPYATAIHRCACGCGHEVVTPLSPTDWRVIFDGKSVSLDPSIGNWSFDCQSHYFIRKNRVLWCEKWSKERIDLGRAHDNDSKDSYYKSGVSQTNDKRPAVKPARLTASGANGILNRIRNLWSF